jgi:hypothetical protein
MEKRIKLKISGKIFAEKNCSEQKEKKSRNLISSKNIRAGLAGDSVSLPSLFNLVPYFKNLRP